MRKFKKVFASGLTISALAVASTMAGCDSPELSSRAQAAARPTSTDARAGEASSDAVDTNEFPVRISRDFFERQVVGEFQVKTASGDRISDLRSDVRFEEGQPEGPEPEPGYIADFRDRPGCANYTSSQGLGVCFTVVPDISSLDVKAGKVSVKGLQKIVADYFQSQGNSDCTGELEKVDFIKAEKNQAPDSEAGALRVQFRAQPKLGTNCGTGDLSVSVILQST